MKMDITDWHLLSLLDDNSLLKISEELFISQPALSYRLKNIEGYFDTKIIKRTNRKFLITTEGELIIDYAKSHLNNLKKLKEDIYSLKDVVKGPLKIGTSNAIAQYLIPATLSQFHQKYESVNLQLKTGFSESLIESLNSSKIHIAMMREDIEWNSYKKLLATDGIYLVSKEPINIQDLPKFNRVEYQTNLSLKAKIDNWWFQNFNESPKKSIKVDSAEACKEMINNDLGYAILTGLTLNDQRNLFLQPLKDEQNNNLLRETWVYASSDAYNYVTVRKFLELLEKDIRNYNGY